MAEIQNFLIFLGLSWVLIITPGPDLIYVLTKGVSSGKKAGVVSAVGVTLGILVHTLFAAFGLSIILQTSAIAFAVVKIAGAVYLIYLGVKSLLSKNSLHFDKKETKTTTRKVFTQGLISNTLNPKVALFFMAFLPQFISSSNAEGFSATPFILLGLVFAFCTLLFLALLGYFSGTLGQLFVKKKSISNYISKISGSILIMLGVRLAFVNQK